MYTSTFLLQRNEKKTERKSRRWAILFLLLLFILIFLPFITQSEKDQELISGIVIQFDEPPPPLEKAASSSEKSSASQAASNDEPVEAETTEATEAVEEPVVDPQPTPEPPNPKTPISKTPTPLPTKKSEPLMTSSEPEINLAALMKDISKNAQIKEISSQITEVTDEVTKDNINEIANYFKNNKKSKTSSSNASTQSGNSSNPGEGDSGTSDSGDSNTDGKSDSKTSGEGQATSGDSGMDFEGDGLISRKVIYRANVDKLIKQTGKMVINLCVNRDGKVIFAEVNKEKSTITDSGLLDMARIAASQYRYEKDYTVAERQCGTLSFIVKM